MSELPESAAPQERPRILLVEDDDGVRRSLHLMLSSQGFDVRSYASAELIADAPIDGATCLVADYRLPAADGIEVLTALHEAGWQGRSVLVTGHPSPELRAAAEAAGYDAVIEKPFRQHELVHAIEGTTAEE